MKTALMLSFYAPFVTGMIVSAVFLYRHKG